MLALSPESTVKKILWKKYCEKSTVKKILWRKYCEKSTVKKILWKKYCENSTVLYGDKIMFSSYTHSFSCMKMRGSIFEKTDFHVLLLSSLPVCFHSPAQGKPSTPLAPAGQIRLQALAW